MSQAHTVGNVYVSFSVVRIYHTLLVMLFNVLIFLPVAVISLHGLWGNHLEKQSKQHELIQKQEQYSQAIWLDSSCISTNVQPGYLNALGFKVRLFFHIHT